MYTDDDDEFDERMENSRKKMLRDEIRCLELTLAKRKAQLREADRLLKECNTDLKCARDEVSMDGLVSYSSMGMFVVVLCCSDV